MSAISLIDSGLVTSVSNTAGWWHPFARDSLGNSYLVACVAPLSQAEGKHNVAVAKISATGAITIGYCIDESLAIAEYTDDAGHSQPSIVVDDNGFIHIWSSMHNHELRYFRSSNPCDVQSIRRVFDGVVDNYWTYTYPVPCKAAGGTIAVMLRCVSLSGSDVLDHIGCVFRLTKPNAGAAPKWDRAKLLGINNARAIYPDDIACDADGNLHLLWEVAGGDANSLRHAGTYVVMSADEALTDVAATALTTPVVPDMPQALEQYQPLISGESWSISEIGIGMQSAKLIWDAASNAFAGVVYRYRPVTGATTAFAGFGLRVARYEAGAWSREDVFVAPQDGEWTTAAAVAATVHGGETRLYFSVEKDGNSTLCAAVGNYGAWVFYVLSATYPGSLRFRMEAVGAQDIGYLTAPDGLQKLWQITVPADITDQPNYGSIESLVSSLSGGSSE